jgi:hypothetical protein
LLGPELKMILVVTVTELEIQSITADLGGVMILKESEESS